MTEIEIDGRNESVDTDWRALTAGTVNGGDGNTRTDHGLGRASGTVRNVDRLTTDYPVLGIRIPWGRDIRVRIDGERVNPHTYDPGGVLGGIAFGRPIEPLRVEREDCDVVVDSQRDFEGIGWEDGLAVGVACDMSFDDFSGDRFPMDADGALLAGLPTAGRYPHIEVPEFDDNSWGNALLPMLGDYSRITGLRVEGATRAPVDSGGDYTRTRALESRGFWNVVDHCEAFHWSHAGLSDRGTSTEFFSCASHHNQFDSLGYGVIFSGDMDLPDSPSGPMDPNGDRYAKVARRRAELAGDWIDRGRSVRMYFDANRHSYASGNDSNYEVGHFVTGPAARFGHVGDNHRPGDVRALIHHFTHEAIRSGPGRPVTAHKVRGTPLEFVHFEKGAFENGTEPDRDYAADPHEDGTQAIEQVCIGGLSRKWWREERRPFENVSWSDVHFGDLADAAYKAPESGPEAPHELVVHAQGESVRYGLEVADGGELFYGHDAVPGDEILRTDRRGDGAAGGSGTDSWFFTGDLVGFEHDGACRVTVDGEEIDPSQYASKPQDPDAEPETPGKDTGASLLPTALEAIGVDPDMSIADVLARAGE